MKTFEYDIFHNRRTCKWWKYWSKSLNYLLHVFEEICTLFKLPHELFTFVYTLIQGHAFLREVSKGNCILNHENEKLPKTFQGQHHLKWIICLHLSLYNQMMSHNFLSLKLQKYLQSSKRGSKVIGKVSI